MTNLLKISQEINDLINQNKFLKEELDRKEEFMKLAIAFQDGEMLIKTIQNCNQVAYRIFKENTMIAIGGKISLCWNGKVYFKGIYLPLYTKVTQEHYESLFSGEIDFTIINSKVI